MTEGWDASTVHPDWWQIRTGVNYVQGWRCALHLVALLRELAATESLPASLRQMIELYGIGADVLADGTAIAWIGENPDDAALTLEMSPEEREQEDWRRWPAVA